MCGPTKSQTDVNQEQINFEKQLQQEYANEYKQNQEVLKTLTSSLTPLIQKGPAQQGYSPEELAALNTEAEESAGNTYAQAAQAANESMVGKGGEFVPSGAKEAVDAGIGTAAETQLANDKRNILENDFNTGGNNYKLAVGALSGVPAAIDNPTTVAAGGVTSAGNAAAEEANAIQKANDSWMGLLGGLAGDAVGGLTGNPSLFGGGGSKSGSGGFV